jgi:hypothetical protein
VAFGRSEPERLNSLIRPREQQRCGSPTAIGFGTYLLISASLFVLFMIYEMGANLPIRLRRLQHSDRRRKD